MAPADGGAPSDGGADPADGAAADLGPQASDAFVPLDGAPGADAADAAPQECLPGEARPCGFTRGTCRAGEQRCSELGRWGACEGAVLPAGDPARCGGRPHCELACDGRNEDCDFQDLDGDGEQDPGEPELVDEDFDVDGDGLLSAALCPGDPLGTDCNDADPNVGLCAAEECNNGLDDDGDELVDAADCDCGPCCPGDREACGAELAPCTVGERVCDADGAWGPCSGVEPSGSPWECASEPSCELACDGIDDDCDGVTDEDFDADGDGLLSRERCQGDPLGTDCDDDDFAGIECAGLEICGDGHDNDGDGLVDDGDCDCHDCCPGDEEVCGSAVGACEQGLRRCTLDATWSPCEGEVAPGLERCDEVNNDCDFDDLDGDEVWDPGEPERIDEGLCCPGVAQRVFDASAQAAALARVPGGFALVVTLQPGDDPAVVVNRLLLLDAALQPAGAAISISPPQAYATPAEVVAQGSRLTLVWSDDRDESQVLRPYAVQVDGLAGALLDDPVALAPAGQRVSEQSLAVVGDEVAVGLSVGPDFLFRPSVVRLHANGSPLDTPPIVLAELDYAPAPALAAGRPDGVLAVWWDPTPGALVAQGVDPQGLLVDDPVELVPAGVRAAPALVRTSAGWGLAWTAGADGAGDEVLYQPLDVALAPGPAPPRTLAGPRGSVRRLRAVPSSAELGVRLLWDEPSADGRETVAWVASVAPDGERSGEPVRACQGAHGGLVTDGASAWMACVGVGGAVFIVELICQSP